MNKVVYKVQLPEPGQVKEYSLTYGFVSRYVAIQKGKPMLWFEVVIGEQQHSKIEVICVGTGWPIDTNYWHLGTILTESGFVWHFYAKYINE